MLKRIVLIAVLAFQLPLFGQDQKAPKPQYVYKLDYVITELESGKKTDQREYTVMLGSDHRGTLRMSSNVRLPTGPDAKEFRPLSIGVVIDATTSATTDTTMGLKTRVEVSGVAVPAGESEKIRTAPGEPITRQFTAETDVTIPLAKPITLFTLDEPNSRRSFEVQVTATLVR